jgi:DNA-directed RNA polymerase specialized sigma24 family protein
LLLLPSGYEEGSSKEDPALTTEKTELSLLFVSLLNGLPPLYRDIALLHLVEGWTHKRIASDKGVPVNTIKTQFRRAKALLEEAVKRYFLN